MSNKTPRARLNQVRERIERYGDTGTISQEDADRILEYSRAYDADNITVAKPDGDSHKTPSTLRTYLSDLGKIASETELSSATAADINQVMQSFIDGSAESVKDDGLAKSTTRTYQMVAKSFYGYHDDLECDPGAITSLSMQSSPIDPDDMLTRDEIQTLRDACDHARDRAIVDFFLYTGQRATAVRTLKLKHINLGAGEYKLNREADGLKGADEQGQRRPLLLAEPSVRNWMELHPDKNNPDAYLLTAKPRYSNPDPAEPIDHTVLTYLMDQLKERTGIQKPLHPHSLRHNFVTICKRDYEMDNDVIKHLIGHNAGSRVMETTYAHLDDDDYIEAARKAIGKAEEDQQSPLTPQICPNCGSNVPDGAKACTCGTVFTPDAPGLRQQAEDRIVTIESEEEANIVQAVLEDLRENPEEYTGE